MDMEKVIKALDDSLKSQHCGFVDGVGDVYAVSDETIKNIIALLKEQEGIISALKSDVKETLEVVSGQLNVVRCKDCKHGEPGACGDGVDCDGVWHNGDWFCADGERFEEIE